MALTLSQRARAIVSVSTASVNAQTSEMPPMRLSDQMSERSLQPSTPVSSSSSNEIFSSPSLPFLHMGDIRLDTFDPLHNNNMMHPATGRSLDDLLEGEDGADGMSDFNEQILQDEWNYSNGYDEVDEQDHTWDLDDEHDASDAVDLDEDWGEERGSPSSNIDDDEFQHETATLERLHVRAQSFNEHLIPVSHVPTLLRAHLARQMAANVVNGTNSSNHPVATIVDSGTPVTETGARTSPYIVSSTGTGSNSDALPLILSHLQHLTDMGFSSHVSRINNTVDPDISSRAWLQWLSNLGVSESPTTDELTLTATSPILSTSTGTNTSVNSGPQTNANVFPLSPSPRPPLTPPHAVTDLPSRHIRVLTAHERITLIQRIQSCVAQQTHEMHPFDWIDARDAYGDWFLVRISLTSSEKTSVQTQVAFCENMQDMWLLSHHVVCIYLCHTPIPFSCSRVKSYVSIQHQQPLIISFIFHPGQTVTMNGYHHDLNV